MPKRKQRAKPSVSSRVRLPDAIDELSCAIRVPASRIDFQQLVSNLQNLPTFVMRFDDQGIRGTLVGGTLVSAAHGHLTVERISGENDYLIQLDLVPGGHGQIPKGAITLAQSFETIAPFLREYERSTPILVSASFAMSLKEWEPTVKLPFAPTGIVEQMPGLPRISGLDFSFNEQSDSQHLHRAFVTTYDGIERMVVRMLLSFEASWDPSVVSATIELVHAHLPILVRRTGGKTSRE